ncbi:MAG: protein kinase, partial [Acidobacteriaceae bacterium]
MGVQPSLRRIGKYEVIDVIGTGGMGIVFRAHDPAIGRTVAIKMLRQTDPGAATGVGDRFFSREMKSTGNLHHKNIVTVYDSGEQDGNPYLVMEYLEGDSVSKIIAERRPIPMVEKLDVVVQICDGLQYAHDRNIIHRDIKPANVMRLADGTAKIVDFGVARVAGGESTIVQAGQLVGSLYYLSPEQINSLPIDGRSDIFSTGVLLYEFLTNELPFKGADAASTFVRILNEEPPPLAQFVRDIPPAMQTVINRALAKNVNDRYQTAEEFGFEILAVQKQLTSAIIADCMKRAEAAMQRHDLERARVHFLEVIRLDRQHERANRLLRDVRKAIQQEQRSSQIVQMRSQAQVALAGGQYEEALACADQALKLDPADKDSVRLADEIRAAISRARTVREALNRAESALFAGDFDEAKDAVEESLRLDPSDSEARALASVVNKELAERSRRQRVQDYVDEARRGIADRNFNDAVDALHQAGELDPADSNVRELLQWAERGQEQEKRRRDLQESTDQIEKALRNGDFASASTISEMGLQRFPDDPTLARLRSISEKQRDIAARRRFVQDQSLAVKILTDQGRLADAIACLSLALKKYPGEPNLESLLALTRADEERLREEREEAARREELQQAEDEARAQRSQLVLNSSIAMRRSLDARLALDSISRDADQLRSSIESADLDEHAKNAAALVLEEVDARLRARDQAVAELEQIRHQIEEVQNVASLVDGDNRLRSIKATFPNEKRIQDLCSELGSALSRLREEHDRRISLLTSLAQSVDSTPAGELNALQQKAGSLSAGFADDARIGVLLQQIESSVSARLDRQAAHARDMESLFADLSRARSLQELARIADRSRSIAALDRTDEDLAARAAQLQNEASRLRALLESLLSEMSSLAGNVTAAATIDDAEAIVPQIRSIADRQPDSQDLQEAATRLLAQIHGRRIEHDLIVQELESTRATLSALEAEEDLSAAAARASECRVLHRNDPTIQALSTEIETTVEGILRERAELRERAAACDAAIKTADQQLRANNPNAALQTLLSVEASNPDRTDLHQKIAAVQKQIEQLRIEQERKQQERITREKAEAEARARAAAAEQDLQQAKNLVAQGKPDESIEILRPALERHPEHQALRATLQAAETELARR